MPKVNHKINILKFLCCLGIVFMHTTYLSVPIGDGDLMVRSIDWLVFVCLLRVAMRVCVPMFFLLSGYLFTINGARVMGRGSWELYKGKFKRRIKSLLIPYIMANIVVFLCFYYSNFLMQGLMQSGSSYCLYDSPMDYLMMFWKPANSVMWFVRDLMIVIVLTPVILPLIKWSKGVLVLVFGALWYTNVWKTGYDGFSSVSFFFFYLGATIGWMKDDGRLKIHILRKWLVSVCWVIALLSWLYCALVRHTLTLDHTYILSGVVVVISLVRRLNNENLAIFNAKFWMPACFFIYAYHSMIQIPMKKGLYVLIHPENPIWNYVIYFSTVGFTIAFLVGVYWLMRKLMPKYTWIFTGR